MTKPLLHPWLSTPASYKAAVAAVHTPFYKLPDRARMIGRDELLSEALSILTECGLPPRTEQQVICAECNKPLPANRRRGSKYCTPECGNRAGVKRSRLRGKGFDAAPPPAPPKVHIGVMWEWPLDQMHQYAVRQVGLVLCNYVRLGHIETPASQTLYNLALAVDIDENEQLRDMVESYLEDHGIFCEGDETIADLAQAVFNLRLTITQEIAAIQSA